MTIVRLRHRHQRQHRRDRALQGEDDGGDVRDRHLPPGLLRRHGARARSRRSTNVAGRTQPACLTDAATGLVDCGNWAESASWAVPATAVSGIYFAKLTRTDTGGASHIVFVVRDDAGHSDLLFQTSDTTWQAYNDYGGNSLYAGARRPAAPTRSATTARSTRAATARRTGCSTPSTRWCAGSRPTATTSATSPASTPTGAAPNLLEHKVFLSVGHDEYWSGAQRANVEAARAAGVNLAFFSGNEVFWKTRWETSIDGTGTPYRTLVSYKETHANAKIDPLPNRVDRHLARPALQPAGRRRPAGERADRAPSSRSTAAMRAAIGRPRARSGRLRFWRNTPRRATGGRRQTASLRRRRSATSGTRTSTTAPARRASSASRQPLPSSLVAFRTTAPLTHKGPATHSLTLYRHRSGALVFGAGTDPSGRGDWTSRTTATVATPASYHARRRPFSRRPSTCSPTWVHSPARCSRA